MFYCNAVGSQTEIVFDGGSLVMNANGRIVKEMKYFEEDLRWWIQNIWAKKPPIQVDRLHLTVSSTKKCRVSKLNDPARIIDYLVAEKNIGEIHQALILGIRDYFGKMGFTKAILGSSGGIDSAVTLALACEAIGHENVRAILLPSHYSTSHSVSDAEFLSKHLGNPYDIIPIRGVYDAFMDALKPVFNDLPFSVAEENMQSRTRGNF